MAQKQIKSTGSKYKYVRFLDVNDFKYWAIFYPGVTHKCYQTEREAAIAIDKILISKGKEPVNILKRK